MLKYMWYFVYSIIFMFAERSGTDLDKTDAACRNDREPFMKLTETGYVCQDQSGAGRAGAAAG